MSYNAEHLCHIMKILESSCGSEKLAWELNISLHPPSRGLKPNNQTQNSSDWTLLLPRCFSDDEEAGTQFSAWEVLGQTLTKSLSHLSLEMSTNIG